jgi:hypothetical protein
MIKFRSVTALLMACVPFVAFRRTLLISSSRDHLPNLLGVFSGNFFLSIGRRLALLIFLLFSNATKGPLEGCCGQSPRLRAGRSWSQGISFPLKIGF